MSILDLNWSIMDWILLLSAIGTVLYYFGTKNFSRFTKYNIPHPKPLPFLGNMGSMIVQGKSFPYLALEMYEKLKHKPYGGYFIFTHPVIQINDPELIKTIAVKDFDFFTDHRNFINEEREPLWTKGLFTLKGQRWREMRSRLSPAFTSSKMKIMFVLVSECCRQLVDFLKECQNAPLPGCNISKEGDLLVLELKEFFTRYTNDVIATTAFGVGVDSLNKPTNEFFMMGQKATIFSPWRFFGFISIPKIMELMGVKLIPDNVTSFFKSLVKETMTTREQNKIVRPDMLQLMIEAKKNAEQAENSPDNKGSTVKMDDEDIIAQALLFFLAGFDTASTLMCFVCYELATYPDIHDRLQKEVDKTLQENGGKFTYEVVNNMKYLDMVVSETLRIYPPVSSIDRICTRRYVLKADPPLEIFAGDQVFFPIFGLHRDPNYFPNPEKFDPERFSDENKHKINPLAYIPFGIGPRICIGNRFALMETKLVIAYILSKFNVKRIEKTPKEVTIVQKGFNISIAGGFWMGLEMRSS